MKNVDAFISPSRFSIDKHREMGFDAPFVHIPVFALGPAEQAIRREADRSEPYFLFVGRLEKIKGLHSLLPIFGRPGAPKLLIAGTGDYELQLRELARGANVEFLGRVEGDRLQSIYRSAIALIVPSVCYEVFPLVALEAFSHKTPVIVRDLGGMAEVVEESGGGLTYKSDEELLSALARLQDDLEYRNTLGGLGYEAYEKKWTAEAHLDRYFELIEQVAARHPSKELPPDAV